MTPAAALPLWKKQTGAKQQGGTACEAVTADKGAGRACSARASGTHSMVPMGPLSHPARQAWSTAARRAAARLRSVQQARIVHSCVRRANHCTRWCTLVHSSAHPGLAWAPPRARRGPCDIGLVFSKFLRHRGTISCGKLQASNQLAAGAAHRWLPGGCRARRARQANRERGELRGLAARPR